MLKILRKRVKKENKTLKATITKITRFGKF